MFNMSLYPEFLSFAKYKIDSPYFNEYDIVHDLFEKETIYDLGEGKKQIIGLIKKQGTHGVNFILAHQIFDDTYVCSKCKEPKPVAAFRLRNECRETYFDYVNDTCRECERKIIKEYRNTVKDTESYKIKNRSRVNQYRLDNPIKLRDYNKERRSTPEYKQYVRDYYQKHREKIRQQVKEVRKRKQAA